MSRHTSQRLFDRDTSINCGSLNRTSRNLKTFAFVRSVYLFPDATRNIIADAGRSLRGLRLAGLRGRRLRLARFQRNRISSRMIVVVFGEYPFSASCSLRWAAISRPPPPRGCGSRSSMSRNLSRDKLPTSGRHTFIPQFAKYMRCRCRSETAVGRD